MKKLLPILPVIAAASLLLSPASRALAQDLPGDDTTLVHTPDKTLVHTPDAPPPIASSKEEPDVFDALKKGITKVQKQAREVREADLQLKALKKQQDAMQQELAEGKERLHNVLTHQAEEIRALQGTVAQLETELKALKTASPAPAPSPVGTSTHP